MNWSMVGRIATPTPQIDSSKCARCGATLHEEDVDCPNCGEPRGMAVDPTVMKGVEVLENKWSLDEKLGQGGMGTVYLASDLQLDRKVAIKTLAPALCMDEEVVARFEREAKMMAKLDHPNLVPIHAVGRWNKVPFIVMKFLEGKNLSDHIREKGRLESLEALNIMRQACAGLGFVHQRGFIHRDIKPANIFVAPDGHVTILDLGVAHDSKNSMTKSGLLIGTPKYMSPEQILGQKIDHRSDLYSLGTVLFEMVTGRPVFDGESDFSVMRAHTDMPPPDPGELSSDIPRAVSKVILKALEKKPADRFQTAAEFAAAFDAAMRPGANTQTGYRQSTPAPTHTGSPTPPHVSPLDRVARATPTKLAPNTPAPAPASSPSYSGAVRRSKLPFVIAGSAAGVAIIAVIVVLATHDGGPQPVPLEMRHTDEAVKVEAKVDPTGEAKVDVKVEAKTEPKAEAKAEAKVEPKPDDGAKTVAKAEPAVRKPLHPKTEKVEFAALTKTETRAPEVPAGPTQVFIGVTGGASWGYVELDGVRQVHTAPMTMTVTPGKHTIKVLQPSCCKEQTKSIDAKGGETTKVRFELEKI